MFSSCHGCTGAATAAAAAAPSWVASWASLPSRADFVFSAPFDTPDSREAAVDGAFAGGVVASLAGGRGDLHVTAGHIFVLVTRRGRVAANAHRLDHMTAAAMIAPTYLMMGLLQQWTFAPLGMMRKHRRLRKSYLSRRPIARCRTAGSAPSGEQAIPMEISRLAAPDLVSRSDKLPVSQ